MGKESGEVKLVEGYREITIEEWVNAGADGDEFNCRDCLESDEVMITGAPTGNELAEAVASMGQGDRHPLYEHRLLCLFCATSRGLADYDRAKRPGKE